LRIDRKRGRRRHRIIGNSSYCCRRWLLNSLVILQSLNSLSMAVEFLVDNTFLPYDIPAAIMPAEVNPSMLPIEYDIIASHAL
jgi:hypothetical protein